MANIKEIARMAGVSVTTVSRVLNNHPYVSKDKRAAVLDTIEQLNYTRNMNAVHLITGRTGAVAVILPYISAFYFSIIMNGIAREALLSQCRLILCQSNYSVEEEIKVLEMLRNKEIDGVVIVSTALKPEIIEEYTAYGPVVTCQDSGQRRYSSVYIEHYAAFRQGLQYLTDKGCRTIGYCEGRQNGSSAVIRQTAYRDFIAEHKLAFQEEWMIYDCITEEDGAAVAQSLLEMPERPEAMIITGDHVAAGLIIEARRAGLSIPGDLAVMGFDNQPIGRLLEITTIDNHLYEMGAAAFRIIHEQISSGSAEPTYRKLDYRIIERSTV
ncbi:LacI family DNA-binding transcriptional regulator [Paenibacillus tritici]|jgi:LacI family transcriptional regulator, purine nucleotide synthesis repressor|uniref:LacI family DNA-binding transcriptional regulator n=1 Tax=Paenibacillus tritici TaxID=1873425 RepID=UPI001BA76E00|nr:LacI family DNA-binding transcriptional regulator [Paenibacillus tritici]QUL53973.1 LacI family DNA-binding transcriptional regulator [Paenibacillus tritici]